MGQIEREFDNMRISNQDRRDLDKYTRFLAYKYTQIIVEARGCNKISTSCLPANAPNRNTENVFSLHTTEDEQVQAITKKVLGAVGISENTPLTVEVSLQTADGVRLALEYWCLNLLPDQFDPTVKVNQTSIYNRMGILLKSLVSVTRVTPGYRMSRNQTPDSYVILYHIFMGEPQLQKLGDEQKNVRIGQICTPIGTIQLNVAYRTKMTMSPTQTDKNNSILMKSDHFNANLNTRRNKNNEDITDLTKPMRPGPFATPNPQQKTTPNELADITNLFPFESPKPQQQSSETEIEVSVIEEQKIEEPIVKPVEKSESVGSNMNTENEYWSQELNAPFATLGPSGEIMQFYRSIGNLPLLMSPDNSIEKTLFQTEDAMSEFLNSFNPTLSASDELVGAWENPDEE